MGMFESIVLGIVQGLTEFLPVSSSGHLSLVQHYFNTTTHSLVLEVSLHLGTLLAVIIFFYKDIVTAVKDKQYLMKIMIATFVTGVIAFLAAGFIKEIFHNPGVVIVALVINGFMLFSTKLKHPTNTAINVKDAVIIGLLQSLAIIPGISRSGITICTMLHLNIERNEAFRFSFLASIPLVLAAFIFEMSSVTEQVSFSFLELLVGTAFAFVSGLVALKILKAILNKDMLYTFGYYCIIIGVVFGVLI